MSALVYWYTGGWSHPDRPIALAHPTAAPPVARTNVNFAQQRFGAGPMFQASDTLALTRIAVAPLTTQPTTRPAQPIVVEGIVASNAVSRRAKYFRITFVGDDSQSSFVCTYKPDLLPDLQSKFGGTDGPGLQGKHIQVKGKVEMFKDRPTIRIEAAEQIELLP